MRSIYSIIVAVCMLICSGVHAETVTRKQAMSVAEAFFNTAYGEVTPPPVLHWNGRQLTTDRLFSPIYVFNHPRGGYVVISADNKAYPILAYSLKRKFDRTALTDAERSQLERYAREIEMIRYDSRIPEKALAAWQNMPNYITDVLARPYSTSEYAALDDAEKEKLELIDRSGNQIMLPRATEFDIYDPEDFRPVTLDDVTLEEEIPFSFYESFIRSVDKERLDAERRLEEIISPSKPVVRSSAAGHFAICFPERIRMMRVYSMGGMQMLEKYFKETDIVNIDLEGLSSGFYVGLAMSESGNIYGFKLFR